MKINPYTLPLPPQGNRSLPLHEGPFQQPPGLPSPGGEQRSDKYRNNPRVEDAEWVEVYDSNALIRNRPGSKKQTPAVAEQEEPTETLHAQRVQDSLDPAIKKYQDIANPTSLAPGSIVDVFV